MTSDKTAVDTTPSSAQKHLEYALGKHRVALADLRPEEFDTFLEDHLHAVLVRELRGFVPLRDVISIRGKDPMTVAETADFYLHRLDEHSVLEFVDLSTQAVKVCRGVCSQTLLYQRTESNEVTTIWAVAHSWGKGAYLQSGSQRILVLARPSKNCEAEQNLFAVDYQFAKVPHERRHFINRVDATQIPVRKFRDYFGEEAPEIARDLIWELQSLHHVTLHALESQTQRMREELARWERLSDSI